LEEVARANAKLQKLIQQSKSQMLSDYMQNLWGAEEWWAAHYANPCMGMTMVTLMEREGKQANTATEKEEMLRRESFPPNDNNQYYNLPPTGSAHTDCTEQGVKEALYSRSVKKAPGPDKLSFGPTPLLWKWD